MELEKIKDKLTREQYLFFCELQELLDVPLYFLGSIARSDFVKNKSDIDVEVFSDNITSIKMKILSIFNLNKNFTNYLVRTINNVPFSCIKYYLKDIKCNTAFDFSINPKCNQNIVLQYRYKQTNLPYLIINFFNIIKFLHHQIGIIDTTMYIELKTQFWNYYIPELSPLVKMNELEYNTYYNQVYPNVEHLV
jgi:predicted nucleotidyltransferase